MHQRSSMVLFLVGVGCWIGMGMNDVATWYKIHIKQYGKKYVTLISVIYYIQTTTTKYSNNEIYIEILIFGASAVHSASPWASMAECLYSNLRETQLPGALLPWKPWTETSKLASYMTSLAVDVLEIPAKISTKKIQKKKSVPIKVMSW